MIKTLKETHRFWCPRCMALLLDGQQVFGGFPRWVTLLSLRFVCNLQSLWQRGSLLKQTKKMIIKKLLEGVFMCFLDE